MDEDKEKEEKRNILKYQELIKDKNTLSRLYDPLPKQYMV